MSIETDKRVRDFLNQACAKIRLKADRKKVRAELLDHLLEAEGRGLSIDEAIASLGDPADIAVPFAQVHRPYYLTSSFYALCLLALAVLTVSATHLIARMYLNRMGSDVQAAVATYKDVFLEDQHILSKEPFFAFAGSRADAGPYLNPLINWTIADKTEPGAYSFLNRKARILVLQETRELLRKNKHDWSALPQTGIDRDFDLGWMQQLSRYDHWDLFSWQPMREKLSRPESIPWFTTPLPDHNSLVALAQLRLLRGLRTKNMKPALTEVRHLARLIYTNETLIGSMTSVAILNLEREAYEEALKQKAIQASEWQPISASVTTRARRALFGYTELFQIGNSDETIAQIASGKSGNAGYCAALAESAVSIMILRDRAAQTYPLEVDLGPRLSRYDKFFDQSKSPCRLTYARALYGHSGATAGWFDDPATLYIGGSAVEHFFTSQAFSQLPWVRQLSVYGLAWAGSADYISGPYKNHPLPIEN